MTADAVIDIQLASTLKAGFVGQRRNAFGSRGFGNKGKCHGCNQDYRQDNADDLMFGVIFVLHGLGLCRLPGIKLRTGSGVASVDKHFAVFNGDREEIERARSRAALHFAHLVKK